MRARIAVTVCYALLAATSAAAQATEGAAAPVAPATAPPCQLNQPPLLSERFSVVPGPVSQGLLSEAVLFTGRRRQVVLQAHDPDGNALTFNARPVPQGAVFDTARGVLTWQPTSAQQGRYPIVFEVTDGTHVAQRTFVLTVQENRAPNRPGDYPLVLVAKNEDAEDAADSTQEAPTIAWDADQDELTFHARKLPAGARLESVPGRVVLVWTPTDDDAGEHELVVDVSDGLLHSTVRVTVLVTPTWAARQYAGWLLLGGGPSAFLTQGSGELLIGGALDITLVAIRNSASRSYACKVGTRDSDCHASYHRFYAQLEVLDSLRSGAPSMFTYGVGYSASFEWYPGRRYLIPHYGIEAGGLVRQDLGHLAQTRPYLGLHVWASDRLWIDAALGYRIVPGALGDLSGPTLTLGVVVNPW